MILAVLALFSVMVVRLETTRSPDDPWEAVAGWVVAQVRLIGMAAPAVLEGRATAGRSLTKPGKDGKG